MTRVEEDWIASLALLAMTDRAAISCLYKPALLAMMHNKEAAKMKKQQ
jgi:hypothetical protein